VGGCFLVNRRGRRAIVVYVRQHPADSWEDESHGYTQHRRYDAECVAGSFRDDSRSCATGSARRHGGPQPDETRNALRTLLRQGKVAGVVDEENDYPSVITGVP
jgi:hypothetical protein